MAPLSSRALFIILLVSSTYASSADVTTYPTMEPTTEPTLEPTPEPTMEPTLYIHLYPIDDIHGPNIEIHEPRRTLFFIYLIGICALVFILFGICCILAKKVEKYTKA